MSANDWPAADFEAHREHLRSVAYRMLGSLTEADDAVQQAAPAEHANPER